MSARNDSKGKVTTQTPNGERGEAWVTKGCEHARQMKAAARRVTRHTPEPGWASVRRSPFGSRIGFFQQPSGWW
jgi:hypothetical protein